MSAPTTTADELKAYIDAVLNRVAFDGDATEVTPDAVRLFQRAERELREAT